MQLEQETMMFADTSTKRLDELGATRLQPTAGQFDQPIRIRLAGYERLDQGTTTHAEHVADDAGDFDVGVLKGLLDALRVLGDLSHKLLTGTREIAELLYGCRRHEARADEPMRQQVSDPHRVVHVGLPAGTLRMCIAFTSTSSKKFSSTCQTGFQ